MIQQFIMDHFSLVTTATALIVPSIFEVSKININPWTTLFKFIGKAINQDVVGRLETLEDKVKKNCDKETYLHIAEKKAYIKRFAEECRNDEKHFKCDFERVIEVHGEYEELLEMVHGTNGFIDSEYSYILEIYRERQRLNDFR